MEAIEIYFEPIKGTATLIKSTGLNSLWKIVFEDKHLIIKHSYINAETYTVLEYNAGVDREDALKEVPFIMWQIDQFIKKNKPRPPKRYR